MIELDPQLFSLPQRSVVVVAVQAVSHVYLFATP